MARHVKPRQENIMIRIGFPAIIYIDRHADDFDAAVRFARDAIADLDNVYGHRGILAAGMAIEVWLQRDRPLLIRVPNSRRRGITRYRVELEVLIDERMAARRHGLAEHWGGGQHTYVVSARDALQAVEAARDEFANSYTMAGLDRADLQVAAVAPHGNQVAGNPRMDSLNRIGLPAVMDFVGRARGDASDQHAQAPLTQRDRDGGYYATVAGGMPGFVRPDREAPGLPSPPRIPPLGRTPYKVEMRLLIDGRARTPRDWPADDSDAGPYYYLLYARDALDAVEAAKDEFAQTQPIDNVDRIDFEIVAVTPYGGTPLD
jgi:hypothetical protein